MRPDSQLTGLLGLSSPTGTLANGYLKVDTSAPPGQGIVGQTIQYHGSADRYTTAGAQTIATLYSDAATATSNPAVTMRSVGTNGGHAAAFTYDLARSVVYTHQGNPAWAGQERDSGVGGGQLIRSDDLFFGAKEGDVQPDWVNLEKVAIPQADEQQHLLANLIGQMNASHAPLPRFWFLPRDAKAAVVMTGDDHGNGGTIGRFQQFEADSPAGCSVVEWQCVRGTSYIYAGTPISDAQAAAFQSKGFEIGAHLSTNCENFTSPAQLEGFYSSQLAEWATNFPSLAAPTTNRTHCIAWSDWASQPKVELQDGIRLDANYYYWPEGWIKDRPGMFTGTGMPMRFADLNGSMIDVYQATTQMTDESGQSYPYNIDTLLNNALGPNAYYGVFTANMHTDNAVSEGANAIVASAKARGVPIVSAKQMLQWLDARNQSSFGGISFSANKLSFSVSQAAGANGLRAMLPMSSANGSLTSLKRNGVPLPTTTQTIKGVEYAFFDASTGAYEASYAADETPPVISNVAHSAGNGTASITWNTDEPADSRVDYGTSAEALSLNQSAAGLTTSHSVQLTGLAPNTTYYYRVTSADAAANSSTEPQPPAPPASFTTPSATLTDTTVADFGAGSPDASTYVSQTEDGEVILKPTEGQEFSGGPGLPAGWSSSTWESEGGGTGASATVSGGSLHVDGALAHTEATFGSGRALEFLATFGSGKYQHVAFTDNFKSVWAMFSTRGSETGQLYASTNFSGSIQDTAIGAPGQYVGSAHRYRIQWEAGLVEYFIDGALVHTELGSFATNLNVAASDFNSGGPALSVDWLHVSPYPASGTFTSRVFDAGQAVSWGAITWDQNAPTGTSIAISVRTGNTPTPDGGWSAFTPIAASGAGIPGSSRYVQYRAQLASGDAGNTPTLKDVSIAYALGSDTTPPTITNRTPAPNATGVPREGNVQVQFSEPMDPASISSSTVHLRKQGAGADVPSSVSYSGTTATLTPTGALDPLSLYTVTVEGSVKDLAGNPLGANDSWSFTTAALTFSFTDTTVSDFGAGSPDANTYVSETENGELILKPAEGQEFSGGPGLPAGWSSSTWESEGGGPGASATVSGGSLRVDGALAHTVATFGSGHALEFVATFGLAKYQHVGFTDNFNSAWAIFSTKDSGVGQLYARTNFAGSSVDTAIGAPGQYVGSAHRYRIQWEAGLVEYFIDGTLVHTELGTFATNLNVAASDFNSGGPTLSVDWLHVSPYPASGTFTSRVFDAGQAVDWGAITWDQNAPTGTSIAISVRTGNTPTPDASWSAFTPIAASGADIPGSSRYVQYRAELATSDATTTPTLSRVTISGVQAETPPNPPTVTSIEPGSGPSAGGTPVTIKGTGFLAGATVTIGLSAATEVNVVSDTEITAKTPAGSGAPEVVVSDTNGISSAGPTYIYIAPPTVESITPSQGPSAGGTAVTIKGKGFLTGATVTIGAAASEVNVVSDTEITAKTAAGTGSHEVVVTDTNGSSSAGPTYAYVAPPSAPTGVTAGAATNQARVSWTAPASDGGSPLTSYTITPYIGTEEQPATTVKGSPPATSATVTGLTNGTSYTFKVAATNEAGTSPPSDASGAVTPRNTIFDFATPQDPPPIADTNSIELGVKFRSEIAGTVTGIRFFKSAANTGTHVGSLWSKEGQLLATATFENETTSGWQQVNFSTPVAINANTTYVAAYLAPNGNYSFTHEAFTTNGVSNPPLSALAAPLSEPPGRNGVYHYSPGQTSVFPDESFADSNYWVDVNFAPNAPAVVTEPASSVTQTTATLNATVNPNGGNVSDCHFEYGTTNSYGSSAPCSSLPGSGSSPVAVSASVTGLTPNTAYHFRISATNPVGTSKGSDETFTTLPNAPTVTSVIPNQGPTAGGTPVTIKGTGFMAGSTVTIGAAATDVNVVSDTEITANTAAHAAGQQEVVVSDVGGPSSGGPTYTYIAPPTVASIEPNQGPTAGGTPVTIKGTGFLAGATVTIGAAATEVTVVSETEITAKTPAGSGAAEVVVSTVGGSSTLGPLYTYIAPPTVTSIEPNQGPTAGGTPVTIKGTGFLAGATVTIGAAATEVTVVSETEITAKTAAHAAGQQEVVVSEVGGNSSGGPKYTYVAQPAAVTEPASSVTQTTATLNATVNPEGGNVSDCHFEYGTTNSYGSSAPCSSLPGPGTSPVAVSASVTGLTPNTPYHFRISATNAGGTSKGSDETFETPHNPPAVVTEPASSVTQTTATLNATVNPEGGNVSDCHFEYGTTNSYGSSAPCSSLPGPGTSPVAVSASVTGLTPNTAYHFRISATNAGGTSKGSDQTFTTPASPGVPHYYSNGVVAGSEPETVVGWGTLALKTAVGGSGEVTCHTAQAGTVENPGGGLAGVGSTQVFATFDCESTSCPFTSVVTAQALPWPSVLEAEGTLIRAKTAGIKATTDCQKEGKSEGSVAFVGADQPSFHKGVSALHPGFLEYDAGSGALEKEGSKGGVQDQIEGEVKILGYEEQELISAK